VPIYYKTLAEAFKDTGIEFGIVIEAFTRTSEQDEPFEAVAADGARVKKQIGMARPHANHLVYFTFPNYIDPDQGAAAAKLHKALRATPRKKAPKKEPAQKAPEKQ
jgi:hypothetical protein